MDPLDGSVDEIMPVETAAPQRPFPRYSRADRAALALAGLVLLACPLYVLRVPLPGFHRLQWLLTESGHFLALALLLAAWWARARGAKALALAAAVLALSPLVRALWLAPRLEVETGLAWGPAPGPRRPLRLERLPLPASRRGVQHDSEAFDPAHGLELGLWSSREDQGLMTRRPVVLVLHGGGWEKGRRDGFGDFNAALARLGWVVADMDYRLAPTHPWPAQREDVLKALEHLRQHARRLAVDPEHVVLLGRSAGAHLALDFAYSTQDPAVRGVVAFYGPSDLRYAWEHGRPGDAVDSPRLLRQLCGGEPRAGGCFDDASPYRHVNAGTPPTLLLHGRVDALVRHEHSERLAERLGQEGVPHQLVSLPWATHGFDWALNSPGGQAAFFALERFLLSSERLKARPRRG